MPTTKKPFLVVYDYGMGGLWGTMMAASEEEIDAKYPELIIFDGRPDWMPEDDYEDVRSNVYDVDEPPKGLVQALLSDRAK